MRTLEINISPRLQQILLFMLKENKVCSVMQLAEVIQVSKRTVQRELEGLEKTLKKYDLEFCSRTGIGVWIEGAEEKKQLLIEGLQNTDMVDATDRIQRRKRLTLEILKDRDLKKLYYYSNLLGVSEATISTDLEAVEEWFASFHLKIARRPGYGITIEGSEKDYRWAMRSFIEEHMGTRLLQDFYENRNLSVLQMFGEKNEKNIYAILDNDILKRVVSCLLSLKDKRILNLTENSYIGLVLHITIAIKRIMKQEIIEPNDYLMETLHRDEDYEFAVYITKMLEKEFDVLIPEIESAYICLHIQGAKRQFVEADTEQNTVEHENRELVDIAVEMIEGYDREQAYVLKQDEEFISGLLAHLQPTFVRLKNRMKITNPLLDQIKKDYADIFEKCRKVAVLLENRMGCEVPEAEIGFLAIHFGAAVVRMEQQKESRRKVHIGIVCASGIGISRLMSTKVKKHFLNRVEIHTYGKTDLSPYVKENMDFFVSTIAMEETETDILYVSPLLAEKDLDEIERRVQKYEKTPKKQVQEDGFSAQLDQINYITEQIKRLIRCMYVRKISDTVIFERLIHMIAQDMTDCETQEQIVAEDLFTREKMGSQVFAQLGFALFHTKTKGVEYPVFGIYLPEEGVQFKDRYFKGIGAAIVMLFPEGDHVKENSAILGYISESLIEDLDFLDAVIGGAEEEIRGVLSKHLKKFFNDYVGRL